MLMRTEIQGEGVRLMDSDDINPLPAPVRHESLPENLRVIIRDSYQLLKDLHPRMGSPEQWEEGFRHDTNPEREVWIWSVIGLVWKEYSSRYSSSVEDRRKILQSLLSISTGVTDPQLLESPLPIGKRLVKLFVNAMKSNPSPALIPAHVNAMLAALEADGLGAPSRQNTYKIIRAALQRAFKLRLIPSNPCDHVERPAYNPPEVKPMTAPQAGLLLEAIKDTDIGAFVTLAVTSGIRQGEIMGLQWDDLDLKAGTLQVRRTLHWVDSKWGTNEPKNAKSKRTIALSGLAVEALTGHKARAMQADKLGFPWIFTDEKGEPYKGGNVRDAFKARLEAAGLPHFRFHDLRHTSASLLLTAGVHPKVVQERLGHSNVGITLDVYSHVIPAVHAEASRKFDDILGKKSETG